MRKIILLIITCTGIIYGQNFNDFVQLKTGNIFIYNYEKWLAAPPYSNCIDNYRMKIVITDTISYSNKLYFHYTKEVVLTYHWGNVSCGFNPFMFPFNMNAYNALRIDSLTGNLYFYAPGQGCSYSPNEIMIDSLNSKLGDTVRIMCGGANYFYTCTDTNNIRKYYYYYNGRKERYYLKGAGLMSNYYFFSTGPSSSFDTTFMTGRVINGIAYGDTSFTFTGIRFINSQIPEKYSLYQNYPNPFNPSTIIRFDIPKQSHVQIIIHDLLGREVKQLINEEKKAGSYEVTWDADDYPSGVYFYKIITDNYSESKKMLLLK